MRIIDQTLLPHQEVYLDLADHDEMASAIRQMRIRGAPALGVAAAYGMALAAHRLERGTTEELLPALRSARDTLAATRPTAVNLFWALERMAHAAEGARDAQQMRVALLEEAQKIDQENEEGDRRLSNYGAELIPEDSTVLTHCNAGALATAGYGTAVGVIKAAWEQGKRIQVFVTETRPLLQGARLTAWELKKENIPFTLIADTMVGHFLSRGRIDCAVVGADRIVANGDTANKIGTYNIAVLAMENAVPFYVAAPISTIDLSLPSGQDIPIEERSPDEVTDIQGLRIAPEGVQVANPAFDVTPHRYISAIITERGVLREPFVDSLRRPA